MSSEAPCHSSVSASRSNTLSVRPGDLGDRDGVREPGDIQRKKKETPLGNAVAIRVILEEVSRKHTELSTSPLIDLEDAGRYHAALIQIQNTLREVLAKKQLEKDDLEQKLRTRLDPFQDRILRLRLVSLSSGQSTLVEVLQKQKHMEEAYVTAMARLSNNQSSTGETQQLNHFSIPDPEVGEAHSSDHNGQRQESHRPVTRSTSFRSAASNNARNPTESLLTATPTDVLNKRARRRRSNAPQPDRLKLSDLIQRGVIPSGSALELVLKGCWHLALLLDDGSIKDSKGKLHPTPESWLELIRGNNIPVSSAYASDKVMLRGKPLSYYSLNMEAEGDSAQAPPSDQHCSAASPQEGLIPEAANLRRMIMNIKIVHLVGDDEWLPSAQMDYYWEKLLEKDPDDWGEL
ncbi:hypothetical protein PBY51_003502 [Eleginops maclovinus]|uniref:Uncharacterized protein n=1 Tax=Eleginops maclovinus TaxID=56733 RepID=A0AAN7Y0W5_ELEMC|nr:hypothetical protein PBY51_003502 [Eleginops maclovinus]